MEHEAVEREYWTLKEESKLEEILFNLRLLIDCPHAGPVSRCELLMKKKLIADALEKVGEENGL